MIDSQIAANSNRKAVLVVSGTHINRIVVSRIVSDAGMTARAVSPPDAAPLLQQQSFAMVIVDGGPADTDGIAFVEQLAALPELLGPNPPAIIFIAAGTALPEVLEPHRIDAVVSKPIVPDRLEAAIVRLANEACDSV